MDKKVLRKKYMELRKTILDKDYKSDLILEKVLENSIFKQANVVAIYVNLKSEVSTEKLISEAFKLNKIVVVPKVINKNEMRFYKIKSLEDLVCINSFNIKEPIGDINDLVLPSEIDLFIVPGICFDKNKNRIGYGNGYYDKYLMNSSNSYKIGLAYNEQILTDLYIDYESTDIKLDEIITDKILIK